MNPTKTRVGQNYQVRRSPFLRVTQAVGRRVAQQKGIAHEMKCEECYKTYYQLYHCSCGKWVCSSCGLGIHWQTSRPTQHAPDGLQPSQIKKPYRRRAWRIVNISNIRRW